MRRVEQLILASRRTTETQEYTATAGVQDEEFIQALNDGQEEIHSIIQGTFPSILTAYKVERAIQNQEAYTVPRDLYLGTRIDQIEYSTSGKDTDYYLIKKGTIKERLNTQSGNPAFYIRRGNEMLLQPRPQQAGNIRWSYQKAIPRLDIRRGTVMSVTLGTSSITDLFLDPSVLLDAQALMEQNFITIVNKNGLVKMRSIPVTAVDQTTGLVTVEAGFTFQAGESIAAGDFACRGDFSSTHSELPELCEKYLLEYCNARILVRDSNTDSAAVGQILQKVEETLRVAYAEPGSDPDRIPLLDVQYLGVEGYYP